MTLCWWLPERLLEQPWQHPIQSDTHLLAVLLLFIKQVTGTLSPRSPGCIQGLGDVWALRFAGKRRPHPAQPGEVSPVCHQHVGQRRWCLFPPSGRDMGSRLPGSSRPVPAGAARITLCSAPEQARAVTRRGAFGRLIFL